MAFQIPFSHSPPVAAQHALQDVFALDPATPIHSPHHSLNSSTSSRTPLHHLSLHEYRKLQSTPTPLAATPPGKSLRRKAAAPALKEVERVPSVSRASSASLRPHIRPLHVSQSAYPLTAHQSLPPSPPPFPFDLPTNDKSFRSQSAEPRQSSFSGSRLTSVATSEAEHCYRSFNPETLKVSTWKPIKRLPKPHTPLPFASASACQSRKAPARDSGSFERPRLSPLQTTSLSAGSSLLGTEQPTISTPSPSLFPQPPQAIDLPLSPPNDKNATPRVNLSFTTTTAPATPPATPAVVHYRGTSFDLVNPHDSLLLHDIETPARDTDSPDYFRVRSLEEPLVDREMTGPRRLYGDLSSAHQNITRRPGDARSFTDNVISSPPRAALRSPLSATYTSPDRSYESNMAVSPLAIRKQEEHRESSRFSLKQIGRTLTRKFGRSPEIPQEELYELPVTGASEASTHPEGDYPRPLTQTYRTTPQATYIAVDQSPDFKQHATVRDVDASDNAPGVPSMKRYSSAPLASLLPETDIHSPEGGRAADHRETMTEGDLVSLYAASSIYSRDGKAGYPESLRSKRKSNPFAPLSPYTTEEFPSQLSRNSQMYSYAYSNRNSHRSSQPLTNMRLSKLPGAEKTDTLSNFVDQYDNPFESTNDSARTSAAANPNEGPGLASIENTFDESTPKEGLNITTGLSQFNFGLTDDDKSSVAKSSGSSDVVSAIQEGKARQPTITHYSGSPPRAPAPLAPPFEYDELPEMSRRPDLSDAFSGLTSYGDTRQLLMLSQPTLPMSDKHREPKAGENSLPLPTQGLEPSSSYSQSAEHGGSRTPTTPQEALDQAGAIFNEAFRKSREINGIPSIWTRRSSGNLRAKSNRISDVGSSKRISGTSARAAGLFGDADDGNENDWETVGENNSRHGQLSIDMSGSTADYSDSEDGYEASRLETIEDASLPAMEDLQHFPGSSPYRHPTPLTTHLNPFSSSPPQLNTRSDIRTAPDQSSTRPPDASPLSSSTTPHLGNHGDGETRPYQSVPQRNYYELNDKETQELLNSGPNDEILYEGQHGESSLDPRRSLRVEPPTMSTFRSVERDNTFDKLTVLGPKGNLTGTPLGTGMHEVGSSEADYSSPGAFGSTPASRRPTGFYASSPSRRSSTTRIRGGTGLQIPKPREHERSPSDITLFPSHYDCWRDSTPSSSEARGDDRSVGSNHRQSMPASIRSPMNRRFSGRAAVASQTKLREMVLTQDARTATSGPGRGSPFPRAGTAGTCTRPSTSDTGTPLHVTQSASQRTRLDTELSPHLLCPEKDLPADWEEQRLKRSWMLFAAFCLVPPALPLYRYYVGDFLMRAITKNEFGRCSDSPKRIALYVGAIINICLTSIVVVAILIAHAGGLV